MIVHATEDYIDFIDPDTGEVKRIPLYTGDDL